VSDETNEYGRCTACQAPVFDAHRNPLEGVVLLTLVQVGGEMLQITVCDACKGLASGRLLTVWHRICAQHGRTATDNEYRVSRGGQPLSEEQLEKQRTNMRRLVANPPIGILGYQPWKEIRSGSPA